jgi:hypothetical protein
MRDWIVEEIKKISEEQGPPFDGMIRFYWMVTRTMRIINLVAVSLYLDYMELDMEYFVGE